MVKNKKILLLDMDMTITDTYYLLVQRLIDEYGLPLNLKKRLTYFGDHTILHPDIKRSMIDRIFSTKQFFYNLPVIRGAKAAVHRLEKIFDIHIITSPWIRANHPFLDKYNWLGIHFPQLQKKIHATSEKHLVYGDLLIDDHMLFTKKWKTFWLNQCFRPKVASLKYSWTDSSVVDMMGDNWLELADKIEGNFRR